MDRSPGGHEIIRLEGEGHALYTRGEQMRLLGVQMVESASLLKAIDDGAEGKGYSIDSVRDSIGEITEDLRKAGVRYEPSGTVIRDYGSALSQVQYKINTIAANCETLWNDYQTAQNDYSDAYGNGLPPSGADDAGAADWQRDVDDARTARSTALTEFRTEAALYDEPYDTWETAYEIALNGLQDANENGVTDSTLDDWMPFIEGALVVLAIAGAVLAVLAIVVGGPIIGLLAVIAGVLTLAFTIAKRVGGRGNNWDMAMAIVGVIPFGSLTKLGGLFKGASSWAEAGAGFWGSTKGIASGFGGNFWTFSKGFGADMVGLTAFREARGLKDFAQFLGQPVVNSAGNATQSASVLQRMADFGDSVRDGQKGIQAAWSRVIAGPNGAGIRTIAEAADGAGAAVINRVNGALNGTAIEGILDTSKLQIALNVTDTIAKPGYGVLELLNQGIDLVVPSDADNWAVQMATP
ncbi:hypothetical protein [Agromyces seonyuensis]|uniref:Uncharacterized protein n=1 Tax=Agromyces seonyuensis TaxID=2662446 RepID=A0A6I4NUR7_9MICO|nr:hypothetical protein [Agromyces seonyuensis]MWB98196.1 hypothetical protein [Agromyces seonyuensis]